MIFTEINTCRFTCMASLSKFVSQVKYLVQSISVFLVYVS